jgi:methylase of polypeptide subunit release factors
MASLASFPWAAAAVLVGIALGLGLAKFGEQWLSQQTDPYQATLENAELREKVEDLQQLVVKLQPLAYKGIRMRFTKVGASLIHREQVHIPRPPGSRKRCVWLPVLLTNSSRA